MRIDIEKHIVATMDPDPLQVIVIAAGERFIQITNHGGWNETFDIEVNIRTWGDWQDDVWSLIATAYGRSNLWDMVEMYIKRFTKKEDK